MHTFKVSPGTQVSDSWTINELLHYSGEMSWKTSSYILREDGDTVERERKMLHLSFNSFLFPAVIPTFIILNIWTLYLLQDSQFGQFMSFSSRVFYRNTLIRVPASFSGLTLVSRVINTWLPSNMFPKATAFSHALSSVLPHNSSRWQLESSVLLLCVGSYGGKNVLLFIQWTFRLVFINGLLEKVFNVLARLHTSLI